MYIRLRSSNILKAEATQTYRKINKNLPAAEDFNSVLSVRGRQVSRTLPPAMPPPGGILQTSLHPRRVMRAQAVYFSSVCKSMTLLFISKGLVKYYGVITQ